MSKGKWDGEVPFIDGEMQEWIDWQPWHGTEKPTEQRWNRKKIVWEKSNIFAAKLLFTRASKGRSAVRFHFDDLENTGRKYSMTLNAFEQAIKLHGMQGQKISGLWTFKKVGQNYTLTLAKVEGIDDAKETRVITEEELEAELDKEYREAQDKGLTS